MQDQYAQHFLFTMKIPGVEQHEKELMLLRETYRILLFSLLIFIPAFLSIGHNSVIL